MFGQEVLSVNEAQKDKSLEEKDIEAMWKSFGKTGPCWSIKSSSPLKNRYVGRGELNRCNIVENPSGKSMRVLRLSILFGNPWPGQGDNTVCKQVVAQSSKRENKHLKRHSCPIHLLCV